MTKSELIVEIRSIIERIVREQGDADEVQVPPVIEASLLLDGSLPIDSLDLATIVIELQQLTNRDPFADGFITFQTVGELADLYAE